MTNIHPIIQELENLSPFYKKHAEALLNLFMERLSKLENIKIGHSFKNEKSQSILSFADEIETMFLELQYSSGKYTIKASGYSNDGIEDGEFQYKFSDESSIAEIIPDDLKDRMQEVELTHEAMSYSPNSLDK